MSLAGVQDVDSFGGQFRDVVVALPDRVIIIGDYRDARVLAPHVAERFVGMLLRANPKVERSAILLDRDHATFNLQVERCVREAQNPSRRTFRDSRSLLDWIDEALLPTEQQRARAF